MARANEATKLVRVPESLEAEVADLAKHLRLPSEISARAMALSEGLKSLRKKHGLPEPEQDDETAEAS